MKIASKTLGWRGQIEKNGTNTQKWAAIVLYPLFQSQASKCVYKLSLELGELLGFVASTTS